MGIETLVAIAQALSYSPITLIRKAGLLPAGGEDVTFDDWQHLLNQLTTEEEEEIRQIVEMKIERRQKNEQMARSAQFKQKKVGK